MRVVTAKIKNILPAKKCSHRFGAISTFSHQTDSRFENSIYGAEIYGFKNNVRLGAFITNLLGQFVNGVSSTEATGLMRHDIYYGTDYWKNPVNGNIEVIPDYYGTKWTALGATYFNVTVGADKTARYPNHGQQMYDVTAGALGHDGINGVKGASNHAEMIGVIENQRSWLKNITGRGISCGSYRNGANQGYLEHLTQWIGMRNSVPSPTKPFRDGGNTFYGFDANGVQLGLPAGQQFTRQFFINFPNAFRWWDSWNSSGFPKEDATAWSIQMMQDCLSSGGWYKDFCHWHSCRANNTMSSIDEFLQMFNSVRLDNFVWTCSKGEAIEYLFIRELAKNVMASELTNSVYVSADVNDYFKDQFFSGINLACNLDCINVPLSVEVDLSGSVLENKQVKSKYGKLVNLGNNKYIIQLYFNHNEGFIINEITEGSNGNYFTGLPEYTINKTGVKVEVLTNTPTKAVLYRGAQGALVHDYLPADRSNTFSNNHIFYIDETNDYRIGIISDFGQSVLTDVL